MIRYVVSCPILIVLSYSDRPDVIVPSNLLYSIWNEMESIAGYQQQDAHEFILALLEGLERHLKVNHHIELPIPLSRASSLANSPLMATSQTAVDPAASTSTDALRRGLRAASFDRSNNCGFLNKRIASRDRSCTFEANDDLLTEGLIAERPPDVVENLHDVSMSAIAASYHGALTALPLL